MRTNHLLLLLIVLFLVGCTTETESVLEETEAELEETETNIWIEKAEFSSGNRSGAVSFTIDDKLFVGTGVTDTNYSNRFLEYNYEDNSWETIAMLPSHPRVSGISFSIGKYGYVGLGKSCIGSGFCTHLYFNDLWRYDPENDSWTKMADFPGTPRAYSTSFVINDKAYVTGGSSFGDNDLWEYNPSTNAWTQKADYPGNCSSRAVSFSLNNKGYVGFGWSDGTCKDFWEYDPPSDTWKEKAEFPGEARHGAVALSLKDKGYLASGVNQFSMFGNYLTDLWKYDPVNDLWNQINTNYPGKGRINMIAGVVENKIIMGLGSDDIIGGPIFDDIWEYIPEQ